jgi:5'-3' exonuclease
MKKNSTNDRLALIDGDVVVYRAGFASQKNIHTIIDDDGESHGEFSSKVEANDFCQLLAFSGIVIPRISTEVVPVGHDDVDMIVDIMLKNIINGSKSHSHQIFISGDNNFRRDIATIKPYKENRSNSKKPVHYEYIREYLIENYPTIISDGAEADDYLSFNQYPEFLKAKKSKRKRDCNTIICTIDKDLRTVPGYHYNITSQKIDWVTPTQANRFFAKQMLMGDNVDNIPGISYLSGGSKKIGPKTADKILDGKRSIKNLYEAVSTVYKEYAGDNWESSLQEIGSLLWMQRKVKQDFYLDEWKKGEYEQ